MRSFIVAFALALALPAVASVPAEEVIMDQGTAPLPRCTPSFPWRCVPPNHDSEAPKMVLAQKPDGPVAITRNCMSRWHCCYRGRCG